jgi:hypothetical protein
MRDECMDRCNIWIVTLIMWKMTKCEIHTAFRKGDYEQDEASCKWVKHYLWTEFLFPPEDCLALVLESCDRLSQDHLQNLYNQNSFTFNIS